MTAGVSKSSTLPDFLKLLAHDLRWDLLTLLSQSDYRVQELVARVGRPVNLVSYHLAQLRQGNLVFERRSNADGRDIYYSLDLERLHELYIASGAALHPFLADPQTTIKPTAAPTTTCARVLFLCTHNSARSQMAEALLRQLGGPQVDVFSAGTEPSTVHPYAVAALAALGLDIRGQRSKHLNEFLGQSFDYIITVCDRVREQCPVFPGDPEQIHWSFADPAVATGSEDEQRHAFVATGRQLTVRLLHFLPVLERKWKRQLIV